VAARQRGAVLQRLGFVEEPSFNAEPGKAFDVPPDDCVVVEHLTAQRHVDAASTIFSVSSTTRLGGKS